MNQGNQGNQGDEGRIDELKKSLYSRAAPDIRTKRRFRFRSQTVDAKTDWEHPAEEDNSTELNREYQNFSKDTSMSFLKKLFIGSSVFFLFALAVGAYLVLNGSNIVSANNIDIIVDGPASVSGGEAVSFGIQVANKNNIKLETVDLSVDFPVGTVDPTDTTKELKTLRELIPDINPSGIGQKTVSAVLYGEENTKKQIRVSVEYRVKGSSAVFQKEKTFDVLISSSPLALSISSFKEVNSGQEFDLSATVTSNSKEVIKNLLLKAVYPFGFTYISSNIKPIGDTSVWKIGDIPPNGKKTITIRGKLEGQDDETRTFRLSAGAQSTKSDKVIATEYIASTQEIALKKPFISVNFAFDGTTDDQDYIASFDKPIKVDVTWFNNLDTAILNGEIHVKLSGTAYDKLSISPDQGLYNSTNNEIVWNSITTRELANIAAGDGGKVSFTITPRYLGTSARPVTNPTISLAVRVNGNRSSETNVPESVASDGNRIIKIMSDVSLGGQIVRSTGPFENIGSVPPRAEQDTTYTVVWTVDTTSSTVTNAEVTASLPPYVKWLGKISPTNEDVSYSATDGQIVWRVGTVEARTANGSGSASRRHQVAFQIALHPSITQVGNILVLVNQATLTAQDDFTGQSLTDAFGTLTTRFSTDQVFRDGDEKVVQ